MFVFVPNVSHHNNTKDRILNVLNNVNCVCYIFIVDYYKAISLISIISQLRTIPPFYLINFSNTRSNKRLHRKTFKCFAFWVRLNRVVSTRFYPFNLHFLFFLVWLMVVNHPDEQVNKSLTKLLCGSPGWLLQVSSTKCNVSIFI